MSLLVLAALALGATQAQSEPFEQIADGVPTPAMADGERFAAFMRDARTVHVIDGGIGLDFDVSAPATCPDPIVLEDVGGGQALFNCADRQVVGAEGEPLLLDLTTRVWHEPPGAALLLARIHSGDESASFTEVGKHWLGGEANGYHSYGVLWLEWHTGVFSDEQGDFAHMPDLGSADLFVPLCRPLRRAVEKDFAETGDGPRFVRFPYEAPFFAYPGLTVQRCGSAHRTRLDRDGDSLQAGGRNATWRNGNAVRAYVPYCGVRFTQTLETAPSEVAHTDGWIYASVPEEDGRFRILRASNPWCPELTIPRAVRVESGGQGRVAELAVWSPRPSDWTRERRPLVVRRSRSLPLPAGAQVIVRTKCGVRFVRWRLGAGRWRQASGRSSFERRFVAPAVRTPARLSLDVRCLVGERGRFALPIS